MVVAEGTSLSAASSGGRRQAARRGCRDRSPCPGGRWRLRRSCFDSATTESLSPYSDRGGIGKW